MTAGTDGMLCLFPLDLFLKNNLKKIEKNLKKYLTLSLRQGVYFHRRVKNCQSARGVNE